MQGFKQLKINLFAYPQTRLFKNSRTGSFHKPAHALRYLFPVVNSDEPV